MVPEVSILLILSLVLSKLILASTGSIPPKNETINLPHNIIFWAHSDITKESLSRTTEFNRKMINCLWSLTPVG